MENPFFHSWGYSILSALRGVMLVTSLFCGLATAGDHNRIHGCVTDESGRPALDARVVARRDRQTFMSNKQNWKADAQKTTGCYEMLNLPEGTYELHLSDRNYDIFGGHLGPPQGLVKFGANSSEEVNLTTDAPAKAKLSQGVAAIFRAAGGGFSSLQEYRFTKDFDALIRGGLPGWYAAPTVAGFYSCVIGYGSEEGFAVADHWCRLGGMQGAEFSKALYTKMSDVIANTLATSFPDFGAATPGDCKYGTERQQAYCVQHTKWSSRDVFANLLMYRSKNGKTFSISFDVDTVRAVSR